MQISSWPCSGGSQRVPPHQELLGRAWGGPSGDGFWSQCPHVTWSCHGDSVTSVGALLQSPRPARLQDKSSPSEPSFVYSLLI